MKFSTTCTLNCYDSCRVEVTVEDGRVVKALGDKNHPLTRGFLCPKFKKVIERTYSPDRLTQPLLKEKGSFRKISWEKAFAILTEKIGELYAKGETLSILHLYDHGSGGYLKRLDERFFNCLGGVTHPSGSLCWGSGYEAMQRDFGAPTLGEYHDLINSKAIILWGRDPDTTNLHLLPFLKEAKEAGAEIVAINPLKIKVAIGRHISLKPGTDGLLALGIARLLISEGLYDKAFVKEKVINFEEFSRLTEEITVEKVLKETGISEDDLAYLAKLFAFKKPIAVLYGYGLQRYQNGGNTVRAINALLAITGNVGIKGGGPNYAHPLWKPYFGSIVKAEEKVRERYFPWPVMANSILAAEPPIKLIFVTRSNPLNQAPDTKRMKEAFYNVPFKVTVDFFLTDTAYASDLIIPATSVFEEEDIVFSSWHYYLSYLPKIVTPPNGMLTEVEFWNELAKKIGLKNFEPKTAREFIIEALEPLKPLGITFEVLREKGYVRHPLAPFTFSDGKFLTPSGKIELMAGKGPGLYQAYDSLTAKKFPYRLLTVHPKDYLHSQFHNLESAEWGTKPRVVIHPSTATRHNLDNLAEVRVKTVTGEITGLVKVSDRVRPDTVVIEEGSWGIDGGGVNVLTPQVRPDMGDGVPFYDVLCNIEAVE
ncbi:molybdopterin-containing oxidoreductase family protein [Carboxydothermus ferrireducens]|uniref:Anaerobic selenocysteine-containing dehydrogenase n=1 Tax=Carboxydothermus ferrireducens DSM 11255 TaxID=1119529 RepID=A0ABX2RA18_9THEO|nr:molybdopterin-dependent oxidoreductase [Carboxydothermus ferrireducens]NYE58026.1 anaerobic selenocysteine-containing dehydrogenase [Carboxydothermus ferrireducens DSM 11255]